MTFAYGLVAGYALCRAVDAAFDRRWRMVGVAVAAAVLMAAFAVT